MKRADAWIAAYGPQVLRAADESSPTPPFRDARSLRRWTRETPFQ